MRNQEEHVTWNRNQADSALWVSALWLDMFGLKVPSPGLKSLGPSQTIVAYLIFPDPLKDPKVEPPNVNPLLHWGK